MNVLFINVFSVIYLRTGVGSGGGGGGGGTEGMCPPTFLLGGNGMFVPPPHTFNFIFHLNYMFV